MSSFDIAPYFLPLSAHEADRPREPVATPPAHQLAPHQPPAVHTSAHLQNPPADYTKQIYALRLLSPPAPRDAESSADLEDLESTTVAFALQYVAPIASAPEPPAAEASAVKSHTKTVSLFLTDGNSKVKHPTEKFNGITTPTTIS